MLTKCFILVLCLNKKKTVLDKLTYRRTDWVKGKFHYPIRTVKECVRLSEHFGRQLCWTKHTFRTHDSWTTCDHTVLEEAPLQLAASKCPVRHPSGYEQVGPLLTRGVQRNSKGGANIKKSETFLRNPQQNVLKAARCKTRPCLLSS